MGLCVGLFVFVCVMLCVCSLRLSVFCVEVCVLCGSLCKCVV